MLILKRKGLRVDFKDDSDGGREKIPGFSGGVSEILPMLFLCAFFLSLLNVGMQKMRVSEGKRLV